MRLKTLSVLLVVLFLAACAAQQPSVTPTPAVPPTPTPTQRGIGGDLRLVYWQAPSAPLNPHLAPGTKDLAACRITYEPLASFDADGNLVPFLAAEIPSLENGDVAADGKSVTWKLKEEVKWSDGEPFTAQDVLFTYRFITDPDVGALTKSAYDAVESVMALDDYTVKVIFKDVNPAWALPFVGAQGMILPAHAFEGFEGAAMATAPVNDMPVGTGPYRIVEPGIKPQEVLLLGTQLVETNKIVYEANPFYRNPDKPYFSRVILRGGGTVKETARTLFQFSDADFAYNLLLDPAFVTEMEAQGKATRLIYQTAKVERILINFSDPKATTTDGERSSLKFPHPFFSDLKVRQAIAHAIDRESIAALYGDEGQATSNILVSPATFASPNTADLYPYDLDKAAALLDEAGWKDTDGDGVRDKDGIKMKIVFQTSANSVRQATQKIVQASLASIGVEVEIKIIDAGTFFGPDPSNPNTRWHFYADLEEYNLGNASPDPGAYMGYWTCGEIPQKANDWVGNNEGRWCNSSYDALYEQSKTEMDPAKRRDIFIQMNDMLIENVVLIPLVARSGVHGVSLSLKGVQVSPWDSELGFIKDWRK